MSYCNWQKYALDRIFVTSSSTRAKATHMYITHLIVCCYVQASSEILDLLEIFLTSPFVMPSLHLCSIGMSASSVPVRLIWLKSKFSFMHKVSHSYKCASLYHYDLSCHLSTVVNRVSYSYKHHVFWFYNENGFIVQHWKNNISKRLVRD